MNPVKGQDQLAFALKNRTDIFIHTMHQDSHLRIFRYMKSTIQRLKLRPVLIPRLLTPNDSFCHFGIPLRPQPTLNCPRLFLTSTDFVSGPPGIDLSTSDHMSMAVLLKGGKTPNFAKSGERSWKEAVDGRTTIRSMHHRDSMPTKISTMHR